VEQLWRECRAGFLKSRLIEREATDHHLLESLNARFVMHRLDAETWRWWWNVATGGAVHERQRFNERPADRTEIGCWPGAEQVDGSGFGSLGEAIEGIERRFELVDAVLGQRRLHDDEVGRGGRAPDFAGHQVGTEKDVATEGTSVMFEFLPPVRHELS
jgi:hypothetical protein